MLLSIVVTIVDGGPTLTRCLESLLNQAASPPLEVLVPYDDTVPGIDALASRFAPVRFLSMGKVQTREAPTSYLGQHELFDRRRAVGIAAVTGDLVAILEDRGVPRAGWAANAIALHAEHPHAVIGGAVENGHDSPLNWAVYFCDFGRYQLPFAPRRSRHATDVNVCYKRSALDSIRPLWIDRYHEPVVHSALMQRGATIFLAPTLIVDQIRHNLHLGALCRERFAWARLYATIRTRGRTRLERATLAAFSALLPPVLLFRLIRDRIARLRSCGAFIMALPCTVVLVTAWSMGEASGYIRGGDDRDLT